MTYAPDDLLTALRYLNAHGAPWASLGCVGDASHGAAGYHIGGDTVPSWDYSRDESPRDRSLTTGAASAIDFAGADWWRSLTLWLVDACRAGAPGTGDIREIIYTPDGQTVRRWDRLGIRSSGDDSHLYHTHVSFFRDSEGRRGSFLDLLRRFFEPVPAQLTEDDVSAMIYPFDIGRSEEVNPLTLAPKGGAKYSFDLYTVSFQNDTWDGANGNPDYALRLFESNGKGWGPVAGTDANGVYRFKSGERKIFTLRDDTAALSVKRVPVDGVVYGRRLTGIVVWER